MDRGTAADVRRRGHKHENQQQEQQQRCHSIRRHSCRTTNLACQRDQAACPATLPAQCSTCGFYRAETTAHSHSTTATAQKAEPAPADPVVLTEAKTALDDALKLPSFQLNVRNQGVNKMLMFLVASQLVTNVGLIAILWYKLG